MKIQPPNTEGHTKFVTINGKRVPVRYATRVEAARALCSVLQKHAAAIANPKGRWDREPGPLAGSTTEARSSVIPRR